MAATRRAHNIKLNFSHHFVGYYKPANDLTFTDSKSSSRLLKSYDNYFTSNVNYFMYSVTPVKTSILIKYSKRKGPKNEEYKWMGSGGYKTGK